jgi:hypothetical protein
LVQEYDAAVGKGNACPDLRFVQGRALPCACDKVGQLPEAGRILVQGDAVEGAAGDIVRSDGDVGCHVERDVADLDLTGCCRRTA